MMQTILNPSIEEMLTSDRTRILFIHVGRCGGNSAMKFLRRSLNESFILFEIHVQGADAKIREIVNRYSDKFVILVAKREPIGRFVSSFNWDKHNLFLKGKINIERNRTLFKTFPNVDALAAGLSSCNENTANNALALSKFGHMGMGQSFYTPASILDSIPKERLYVYDMATFDSDLMDFVEAVSGNRPEAPKDRYEVNADFKKSYRDSGDLFPTELSATSRKNLEHILADDIQVYERLESASANR